MLPNGGELEFSPVGILPTSCNMPDDKVRENIQHNIKRDIPRLHLQPDYGKYKGYPLAIVAGGPSLDKTLHELREFPKIMVCGSAHDPLIERGFVPDYAVMCDAHPSALQFMNNFDHRTSYLIASMCDPSVFDALYGHSATLWHSYQGDNLDILNGEPAIMGGCTVTLRALNIAIMLGFQDLHFFGLDSSFEDCEYAFEGNPVSTRRIPVRVGDRQFTSTPAWLAQATHFGAMCKQFGFLFSPTVHGDGMIAEMLKRPH